VIAIRTAPGQQIDSAPRKPDILGRNWFADDLHFCDASIDGVEARCELTVVIVVETFDRDVVGIAGARGKRKVPAPQVSHARWCDLRPGRGSRALFKHAGESENQIERRASIDG